MTAAALVAFLMTAVEALTVVMTALVTTSVVMTAVMAFTVVIASGVGIILQRPLDQRLRSCIRRAAHAAVKLNSGLGQCVLRTHADAPADQRVRLGSLQETGQCAVPAAVGGNDLLRDNPAILHVVKLKLLGMTEMLEDLSVFISYCDSHISCSFLNNVFRSLIVQSIVSAPDQELSSVYQCVSDFSPCTLVDGCHGGAGDAHLFGALLLGQPLPVKQTDCLKLVQSHHDWFLV